MKPPPIDISPFNWEIVRAILQRRIPECEVWAFGSRAEWTAREYSDLDLAVIGEEPLGLAVRADLAEDFEESDLPFKVDVVDWATTKERFRRIIEKQYVVVQEARVNEPCGNVRLEGICEAIVDCPHSTPAWRDSGVVVLRNQNIRNGCLDLSQPSHTDEAHFVDRTKRARPAGGDLVITREAPMGEVCMIPAGLRCCLGQRMVLLRPNRSRVEPRYLLYALQSPGVQREIRVNEGTGSTVSNLRIPLLSALPIPIRSLPEQRAIAHILGTLDDKIELNRRMNETLEAMAQALFKSWFVDFDPVRAKAEGRDTGLPEPIANLFPDRLVESELGEIPEGWEVQPLTDAIEVNPTRSLRKGDLAPYLDMANMPTTGHTPEVVVKRPFGSGMRFINGDTLVARITPCLENGKTAHVDFLEDGQVGWGSTEYIVLRPKPPLPEELAYCLARSQGFRDFAIQTMTGTSGRQRVPTTALSHFRLALPASHQVSNAFGHFVKSLFARATRAAAESRTLAALRDTLLPKLISGDVRVKDAERIIGRAV